MEHKHTSGGGRDKGRGARQDEKLRQNRNLCKHGLFCKYLLLTEFEGRTVSYGPSFFLLDLWP